MTSTDFIQNAKVVVAKESGYVSTDVQPVWFGYVLGNMKAILCIPGAESLDMFEVTYNRAKGEMYVDSYTKYRNTVYGPETLSHVAE